MLPFHRPLNWFSNIKLTTHFLYLSQDVYLMMIVFSVPSVFLTSSENDSQSVKHDA